MVWAITAIRLSGGKTHRHITNFGWLNIDTGITGESSTAVMVDFIEEQKRPVRVGGPEGWIVVGVVQPESGSAYLRTHADGVWTDSLLALPQRV